MNKARLASLRGIGKNAGKMTAMTLIVALGFAFIFGVSISPSKVRDTFDESLKKNGVSDFQVKSLSAAGFTEEEIEEAKSLDGVYAESAFCIDSSSFDGEMSLFEVLDNYGVAAFVQNGMSETDGKRWIGILEYFLTDQEAFVTFSPDLMSDGNDRLFAFPSGKSEDVNVFNVVEGEMALKEDEIVADSLYCKKNVGDAVSLFGKEYRLVGKVSNPLYFARTGEPDLIEGNSLDSIYYLPSSLTEAPSVDALIKAALEAYFQNLASLPDAIQSKIDEVLGQIKITFPSSTDLFLRFEGREGHSLFSKEYREYSEQKKKDFAGIFKNATVLSLNEDYSYALLKESCDKMDSICYVIPIFFLAVAGLVVSITMSRMIEEERPQIACLSSLGYRSSRIATKYLSLSFVSTILGIGLGMTGGYFGVFPLIYEAFEYPYRMPVSTSPSINFALTLVSAAAMLLGILLITLGQLVETMRPLPSVLLLPKSPGNGTSTSLDRGRAWGKLPFRLKSTIRNLVRYKKRLFMTAISVGGSTAIVFLGFALLNIVSSLSEGDGGAVAKSIVPVSYFLIAFAILLSLLVLYSLTDMSIAERSREIATLEVLGYTEKETVLYLYREIGAMAFLGLIIGVPLGLGIMKIVIYYLNFGSLSDIRWYTYLLPIAVIGLFSLLVDFALIPKIRKIDMISSLKSVD